MEQTMGKRIAANRKRLALTQDQLAEKLGVTAQAVSKWENDQSCPDIAMLPKLAELFGVTTDELLGVERKEVHQAEVVEEQEKSEDSAVPAGTWEVDWNTGRKGGLAIAMWVLLTGATLLYSNIASRGANLWDMLWTTGLLVFGLWGLWPKFSFLRLGCALLGGYFVLNNLQLAFIHLDKSWVLPILLLLFGMSLLMDALRKNEKRGFHIKRSGKEVKKSEYSEDGEFFSCSTSFGENHRSILLPRVSGGRAEVSFGELSVDLSSCGEIADRCSLKVSCAFGEMVIRIPKNCRVEPSVSTSFAALDYDGSPAPDADTVILLSGSVSFGELTVEYI